MPPKATDPVSRIMARIEIRDDHWICSGSSASKQMRPVVWAWGKKRYVARVLFERLVRPLEDGEQINHHCDYPPCVNPDHLYAGTQSQNNRDTHERTLGLRTHCKHGHVLTPDNTLPQNQIGKDGLPWKTQTCRECGRAAQRRQYQKRKARAAAALIRTSEGSP